jgi:xanthine dehydrogenase small subunit
MRDFLLLYVNGVRHEIRGARAFGSLSDFLRNDLRLTGTKIVCAEGDCGSCTALVGRVEDGSIRYRTVMSCIQFLYQLDGAHVVTVEGLKDGNELNPVQRAMVACHGAQCGFCTPGFVVAMCGMLEERKALTQADLRAELVGNLCRCTGYEAILTAGASVDASKVRRVNERFDPAPIVQDVESTTRDSVTLSADDDDESRVAFVPETLGDALAFKASHPDCIVFAGGTDLGVQINKGRCDAVEVLVVTNLPELRQTSVTPGAIVVGACADWATLERLTADAIEPFATMLGRFASPAIKNAGTIGGNIANGSPIADSMPALYVLGATIELASACGVRSVDINDFFTGYKRTVMTADEIVTRVTIPRPASDEILKLYKISKRQDLDISSFNAAFLMTRDGGKVGRIGVAYGGVGPNVIRLTDVERSLVGQPITEDTFTDAGERAVRLLKPISDVRGSAGYRSRLAANLFVKFFHDVEGQRPTRASRLAPVAPTSGNGHIAGVR